MLEVLNNTHPLLLMAGLFTFLIVFVLLFPDKGWWGEKRTGLTLWLGLDSKTYKVFSNLIIPSSSGTAQIDHLVVSSFGIFIIETKNLKGWIYGSKDSKVWTQVIYKKKFKFQNPLHQTYRQKKVLMEFLGVGPNLIDRLVYFNGVSTFKTDLPSSVIDYGLCRLIKSFKEQRLEEPRIAEITTKLNDFQKTSKLNLGDHLDSLQVRHSKQEYCPKCNSLLVERTAKKGKYAGEKFLGCSNYPRCRFISVVNT